ncbi:sperm acrosome membrane-associated protein 4 [Paroedura picta]|uniref:sperm acrosome membrane-associated protein 4 n=1 Tax=Paroedura picta TaxID=143630 RepID=UPI004056ED1A
MKHPLFISLFCLLTAVWPPASSKECYYCEITSSTKCPSTRMICGDDEDCFVGQGAATGVSLIKNKGCTRAISCGKEQPISYMGVTYSLVTNCCQGDMCNTAQSLAAPSLLIQLLFTSLLLLS